MKDREKPDTLYGIQAIADHIGTSHRKAKYRAETGMMPVFKMGKTVCASRAALDAWLAGLAAGRTAA